MSVTGPREIVESPTAPASEDGLLAPAASFIPYATVAVATVLGVTILFGLLYRFHSAVFLLFVAYAFQVALDPLVGRLTRLGLSKVGAVLLVYAGVVLLVAGTIWVSAPVLGEQARALRESLPESYLELRTTLLGSQLDVMRVVGAALPTTPSLELFSNGAAGTDAANAPDGGTSAPPTPLRRWVGSAVRGLFATFCVMALALYWTVEGDSILRRLVMKAPPDQRSDVRAFIAESQVKIGAYFRGQGVLCVLMGVITTAVLLALGVPYAPLLGLLMAILEAVPVIGSLLGSLPVLIVTASAAPDRLGLVIVALVVIQLAEANLLAPRVMKNAVGVSAIVSITALGAFGALFGFAGMVMGIPLAAILQILMFRLLFKVPIGDESPSPLVGAEDVGRARVGVLRLEAKELVQAIRRNARGATTTHEEDLTAAHFEDEIEAIAAELDALLATSDGAL